MDTPPAEMETSVELVEALVHEQHPEFAGDVRLVAHGWDNDIYRLGDEYAVRLPRRAVAVPLIEHEQRWLSNFAALLQSAQTREPRPGSETRVLSASVGVPTPVAVGTPSERFPWPWSITPWFTGVTLSSVSPSERSAVVLPLAACLRAIHSPAPTDAPRNAFRGVNVADRTEFWIGLLHDLHDRLESTDREALADALAAGRAAPQWPFPRAWLHGDLHPANIVVDGGRLVALVDFGDLCAGDPASDLAVAWLAFGADDRAGLVGALSSPGRYDDAIWTRARAWAAGITLAMLAHSDDAPELAAIGRHALVQLRSELA